MSEHAELKKTISGIGTGLESNTESDASDVDLSVVTTLYQSAEYIAEFCERVSQAAKQIAGDSYEIVLVNDGSPDNSHSIAIAQAEVDPHIVVIDLSRNFGHHQAIMTGLRQACGRRIFLIDVDLEEPPECLSELNQVLSNGECDVAYGIQTRRKGGFVERNTGALFWSLIRWFSRMEIPANPLTARLMTKRYVNALLAHNEREVFLAGLWHITGFVQVPVSIQKSSRGVTTYGLRQRFELFVNSITSFSNAPLVAIFYVGLLISTFSFVWLVYLVFARVVLGNIVEGWTSVIVSVWLLGGLMISFIGIVGIYLAKVFSEVKQRPHTIIRDIYKREK
ncbi:MAG: glycosyltransferase family 2 protein [Boseongicola sp.]